MERSWRNLAIALAGAVQAVHLVEQLAKTGYLKSDPFETAINSLINQNPTSAADVFGDIHRLRTGFEVLNELLTHHRDPKNADLLRYTLGVMHIQKRLARRKDVLYVIGNRLEKAATQIQHFGPSHDNVVSNIADIYSDTISKFQYRIQVTGEYHYLQQPRVASQIRCLLLAAIRAITLWRQIGGSRWQLLIYRNALAEASETLLKESKAQ